MQRKRFAYYYVAKDKWIALGSDRNKALLAWAQLEQTEPDESLTTLAVVAERYRKDELPKKAPSTQTEYTRALKELLPVFGKVKLEAIQPKHIRAYLDRRSRQIAGNRRSPFCPRCSTGHGSGATPGLRIRVQGYDAIRSVGATST